MKLACAVLVACCLVASAAVVYGDLVTEIHIKTKHPILLFNHSTVDTWLSYGGNIQINGSVVMTSLWDTDGDVFFTVMLNDTSSNSSYCVLDSSEDPRGGNKRFLNVVSQSGIECEVFQMSTAVFWVMVTVTPNDTSHDCNNLGGGVKCPTATVAKPFSGYTTHFIFPSDVQVQALDDTWGGDLHLISSDANSVKYDTVMWDSDGDVYMKVTTTSAGPENYCTIDSGLVPYNPSATHVVLEVNHGLACNVVSVADHTFAVFVKVTHMFDCSGGSCSA